MTPCIRLAAACLIAVGCAIGWAQSPQSSQLRLLATQPAPRAEPLPPPAVSQKALTLPELEGMALAGNPSLAQAAARVDALRGQWLQSGLYPNPSIGYVASEVGNEGRAGQEGLFVSQEFVTGGKLRLNRNVAAQQVQQAQQQLEAQRLRVINDVRSAFYEVLIAQRLLDATRELMRIGDEGVRTTETLKKALEASRVDVLQATIEADAARVQFQRAQNRHLAAWRRLTAVAGTPQLCPTPLAGDLTTLPYFDWCESLARVLASSPELSAAQAEIGRASWALRRAEVQPRPNVDLQASTQYDAASEVQIANVQLGVAVPLFDRNQGNIRRAQAEIAAARADVSRVELHLQSRLATAFERYANARQQTEIYTQRVLPNAKESLELVTLGYRQGEFSYLTLLTAQRTFAQTNLAYLEALRELRQSAVAIDGLLLGDSLSNPGER